MMISSVGKFSGILGLRGLRRARGGGAGKGVLPRTLTLPTQEVGEIRLRVVARPEKPLAQLLVRLGLKLPNCPKIIANVVPKIDPQKSQPVDFQASRSSD
jgi:hypothetical protein